MEKTEKGTIVLDLDNQEYPIQYEINNFIDSWFDLTIWYKGTSITERVPGYTLNPHDDVKSPHGEMLLRNLLEATKVNQ